MREATEIATNEIPPTLHATASPTVPLPTKTPTPWPTVTPFANEVTFDILGQIGGPVKAVAVKGRTAYLGVGPQVWVLDVSNPAAPRQLGQSGVFPDFVEDIAIVGDLVYVAAGNAGLQIMDLTKPLSPRQVNVIASHGSFEKIIVRDNTIFIAENLEKYPSQQDVTRIFDISDPKNPHESNHWDGQLLDAQKDKLYIIENKVLKVINFAGSHASPEVITTGLKNASAIDGQFVYTIDVDSKSVGIIDLSDIHNPTMRGSLKLDNDFLGKLEGIIKINPDLIYVKNTYWGESGYAGSALFMVDVSNPDLPRKAGSWSGQDEPSEYGGIFGAFAGEVLEDKRLYLALESVYSGNGLWIVDISNPTNLHKAGSFSALTGTLNAIGVGDLIYALRFGFPNDLVVIDPANLHNIQDRRTITGISGLEEMALKEHYLYLTGSKESVLDVSKPFKPLKQTIAEWTYASNIKIVGKHACVSTFNGGLDFFDLSNPAHPSLVSHLDTGNIGYLACTDTEAFYVIPSYNNKDDITSLHIVDASNLAQPTEVASQNLAIGYVNDIVYGNGYLYVTVPLGLVPLYHEQLLVFDISDKTHLRQVNALEIGTETSSYRISTLGHYLYLASEDILVFDIYDPAHPRPVGKMNIPGGAHRITIMKKDTLLVTAYGNGIFIVQINGLK